MEHIQKATAGQYLTFQLKGQGYGVQIGTVREINRVAEITRVPQAPRFVAGVINLRGKVIPVVNLRCKFGMEAIDNTKETCIIVIEGKEGQIGMIVDSVTGVQDLAADQIEAAPAMGNEQDLAYVIGMGKIESKVLILIDIVRALGDEIISEARAISA